MSIKRTLLYISIIALGFSPLVISAVETTSIESTGALFEQLNELLAQVESLQAQLASISQNSEEISRNLKLGDKGEDVKSLQIFLNSDKKTQIADSGPGSPGEETTYFGPLTKNAVIALQELYTKDILAPVGLSSGTGYVGPSTRAKLNNLVNAKDEIKEVAVVEEIEGESTFIEVENPIEIPNLFDGVDITKDTDFYIVNISDYYVRPGDTIQVSGTGFSELSNTITFGEIDIENVAAVSPESLMFEVPDILPSVYTVSVSNGFKDSHKVDIIISEENPTGVTIENVTPDAISKGTVMTIHGTGFTPSGNMVFVDGFNVYDLNSPDGKSISFVFSHPKFDRSTAPQFVLDVLGPELVGRLEGVDFDTQLDVERDMPVRVVNSNGESETFISKHR